MKLLKYLIIGLLLIGFTGCGSSNTSSEGFERITISHMGGVDFSENSSEAEWDNQDGYTVAWSPTGMYLSGEARDSGLLWYSNNASDNTSIYLQDLGVVTLASVKSIDETQWLSSTEAQPALKIGHVYVVKTRDGFAKFKVIEFDLDEENFNWSFTAEYVFSTSTTF
jgi:hypothetical protein